MDKRIKENSQSCVGCANCENICQSHAIKMRYDEYGFLSPHIDETKCVNCGRCVSVCQMYCTYKTQSFKSYGYIAISKDKMLYQNAASGGIFSTVAADFLSKYKNGSVVGAAYENGKVSHIIIKGRNEIIKLQNSKYVQSDMNSIVNNVKTLLDMKNNVLFSGTPCQVYALKLFLKKEYDNLFTMDLVCHGVPSPCFLEHDLKQYSVNVKELKFRYKRKLLKSKSGFILSFSSDGKRKYYLSNRDLYYALFMKNLSFRKACYHCKFANLNRVGDITIGDCDSYAEYPMFHSKEATSSVIINNLKGKYLWNISNHIEYSDLDIIKETKINTQLSRPSQEPDEWEKIMDDIKKGNFEILKKKYSKPNNYKAKLLLLKNMFLP